jgi:hypothetical protein
MNPPILAIPTNLLPIFDSEDFQLAVYQMVIYNFNAFIDYVTADKAKNNDYPIPQPQGSSTQNVGYTLTPALTYLGANAQNSNVISQVGVSAVSVDGAAQAVNVLGTNRNAYIYDPFIELYLAHDASMESKGDYDVELAVFVSLTDPKDGTGKTRMTRYTRVLREIFSVMKGNQIGNMPLTGIESLPCVDYPKPDLPTERRLLGGIKLKATW